MPASWSHDILPFTVWLDISCFLSLRCSCKVPPCQPIQAYIQSLTPLFLIYYPKSLTLPAFVSGRRCWIRFSTVNFSLGLSWASTSDCNWILRRQQHIWNASTPSQCERRDQECPFQRWFSPFGGWDSWKRLRCWSSQEPICWSLFWKRVFWRNTTRRLPVCHSNDIELLMQR